MVRREKSNYVIQSVAHALDVLEQFAGETDELGVTDLSKRLKLHKNNVFRLLATLESRGYIEQNKATENYRLGIRCLQIGQTYVAQMGLLRQARPIMEAVVGECSETVYLGLLRRGGVVPLHSVEADQPVRAVSLLGRTLPLHCTAAGKVHLAFESEEEIKNSLPETLERFTERTIVKRNELISDLRKVAERGFALESGEYLSDLRSIAVPIRDYTRAVVGSLSITAPEYRLPAERLEKVVAPIALKAGRDLSNRLGYNA
jgi:IclR family transcriptional regulator, KDG regulon repressor